MSAGHGFGGLLPDFTTLTNQLNAITQAVNNLNNNLTTIFGSPIPSVVTGILTTQSGIVRHVRVVTAAGAVTMASTDDIVVVDKTVAAATTVNLISSPTTGTTQVIKDGKGDALTNNITLTPAAGTIDGAASYVINTNYGAVIVVYNGNEWSLF